jgi:hypothetical protein
MKTISARRNGFLTHCYPVRSGFSNTLLPCEKWVHFRKEYFQQFGFPEEEIGAVVPYTPIQLS